ncbi:MAG: putative tricarboxylic transport membrane protein [Oceanospirillaceae bacterium]|jgi:putative tricarboxylic transport membrane protein
MDLTKDRFGGLLFLLLSVTYGYYAADIPLLPGDRFEPFHAQTLPYWLSGLGIIFSVLLIVLKSDPTSENDAISNSNLVLMLGLMAFTFAFSVALPWLGFPVTTSIFLASSYWLLGERRPKMLLFASVPFALVFWLLLTQVLDVYIAPARFIFW